LEEEEEVEDYDQVEAGFGRVMAYYTPKAVAYLSVFVSALCGLGMPLFGYCVSEFTFIIILGPEVPTFIEDRNRALL